jgi:hypothetical protein
MINDRILLIGYDESEAAALIERLSSPCISHEMLPKIVVKRGQLFVESPERVSYIRVSRLVFHGIFEQDLEFLAALALWGGPCFPNPTAMMNCRLRLPCLVHALRFSKFGGQRGYASPDADYDSESECVAKWGNWHCGENKELFTGSWTAKEPTLFEPFLAGEAVRVVILGTEARQIRLTGKDWRKSVHGVGAEFMAADPDLVADSQAIREGLGLDIIANDYIVSESGRYLLEVNHIPSVTCFPELWQEYVEVVAAWVGKPAALVAASDNSPGR